LRIGRMELVWLSLTVVIVLSIATPIVLAQIATSPDQLPPDLEAERQRGGLPTIWNNEEQAILLKAYQIVRRGISGESVNIDEAIELVKSLEARHPYEYVRFYNPIPPYHVADVSPRSILLRLYELKGDWPALKELAERMLVDLPPKEGEGKQWIIYPLGLALYHLNQSGAKDIALAVFVNGSYLPSTPRPQVYSNRTFVAAKDVAKALDLEITLLPGSLRVVLKTSENQIILASGEKQAVINGAKKKLDVAPFAVEKELMVPLRAVAETFGWKVSWAADRRFVYVETPSKG